jgi:hypothetical protein
MMHELTYEEQLDDERWQEVRSRILQRDSHTCRLCGAKENLNVHHRYYIFQHEPWAYYDNALITLCQSCHKMVHDTLPSIVYAQNGRVLKPMKFTPCKRCDGYGYLSEYRHIQNGICFRCNGLKYEELINKSIYSVNEYIDNKSEVYDSIDSIDADEAEMIFQKAKSLHKENSDQAKKYYLRVAKLGYGKAQNNLGLLLEEEGDLDGAKRWLLYSAMQGIKQGKSNLVDLLRKIDKDNSVIESWCNLMLGDKDFQCRIAFETLAEFLDETINEEKKPSIESIIFSMDILTKLASEGHELSNRLVHKHEIDTIYSEFLTKLKKGDFEEKIEEQDISKQCAETETNLVKSEIDEKYALYGKIKELEDWLEIPHNSKILEQPYDIMNEYLCNLETERWEVAYSEMENSEHPVEVQKENERPEKMGDDNIEHNNNIYRL